MFLVSLFLLIFRKYRSYLGGQYSLNLAAKFDGTGWTQIGRLVQGRYKHRSVGNGNTIMHIGGSGNL